MNKRQEYIQRGLPHYHKDGTPCQCRECEEARSMGLGEQRAAISPSNGEDMMLFAAPDWKPKQAQKRGTWEILGKVDD